MPVCIYVCLLVLYILIFILQNILIEKKNCALHESKCASLTQTMQIKYAKENKNSNAASQSQTTTLICHQTIYTFACLIN